VFAGGRVTPSTFGARFESLVGRMGVESIISVMRSAPTILLAGEAGTGKSSVAAALATALGGTVCGTGAIVRTMASDTGVTLAEYNRHLAQDPAADVALDARAAAMIARGDAAVFESRLAGHLGTWLHSRGRAGLTTVLLRCAPVELARRLVTREASPQLGTEVVRVLAAAGEVSTLTDCIIALASSQSALARAAIPVLEAQIHRTVADRRRLHERYGVEVNDPAAYDAVLDTSTLDVTACTTQVLALAGLRPRG
jgi:cytidylate kinase